MFILLNVDKECLQPQIEINIQCNCAKNIQSQAFQLYVRQTFKKKRDYVLNFGKRKKEQIRNQIQTH